MVQLQVYLFPSYMQPITNNYKNRLLMTILLAPLIALVISTGLIQNAHAGTSSCEETCEVNFFFDGIECNSQHDRNNIECNAQYENEQNECLQTKSEDTTQCHDEADEKLAACDTEKITDLAVCETLPSEDQRDCRRIAGDRFDSCQDNVGGALFGCIESVKETSESCNGSAKSSRDQCYVESDTELGTCNERATSKLNQCIEECRILPAFINVMKFNDINGDGIKDIDEPEIQGWSITLMCNDVQDAKETDGNGETTFEIEQPPEQCKVSEEQRDNWQPTTPESVDLEVIGGTTYDVAFGNKFIVEMDIKPGSFPNSINTKSMGVVPVAILGSEVFDVTDVDVTTLAFGPDGATPAHYLTNPHTYNDHLQDVNDDGFLDLVSHYKQKKTGIKCGDIDASLTGALLDGTPFEVTDSVNPICKP